MSDVLITDYSSVMFSYLLTKKPCFLYLPDLLNYIENDRKLYFDICEL
ncbi:CDP-glycerol glycerophosphotransferase family protein, partial [Bacillus sp. JJ1764]